MNDSEPDWRAAKSRLSRKIANVFPGSTPEWHPVDRGIAFRLVDDRGRFRSNVVRVMAWHKLEFTRSWLERRVRQVTGPEGGFPRV